MFPDDLLYISIKGHHWTGSQPQKGADTVEKVENRMTSKISRKLNCSYRHRCKPLCGRYEGRWPAFETMWSPCRCARNASAVFKIFLLRPKKTFSTLSAIFGSGRGRSQSLLNSIAGSPQVAESDRDWAGGGLINAEVTAFPAATEVGSFVTGAMAPCADASVKATLAAAILDA